MVRAIGGVVGGLVAWTLIATALNLGMRLAWSSYGEAEGAMNFTPAMMTARLLLGALASVAAGLVVALIARRNGRALAVLVGILIVVFIPVHYALWQKFSLWYHAVFFASLAVMPPVGARLWRRNLNGGSAG